MIFRRRRIRIEIERTTVRLEGGDLHSAAPQTPSPTETTSAQVLSYPLPEPTGPGNSIRPAAEDKSIPEGIRHVL
jgi:hypothetical protein